MDAKMAEMRRAAAARYKQAPQSEKPTIRLCDTCGKPVYDSKICPVTGVLHDAEKQTIVGGKLIDSEKKSMTGKELMEAINHVRVRWQQARVGLIKIDGDSIGIFQSLVMQREWKLMRAGVLYGTVSGDGTQVTVDAIYEPEQEGSEFDFHFTADPRQEKVDKLAAGLGLTRVGLVVTHQMRDQTQIVLTGKELLLLTKEQSLHGDHCILVTIGPDAATQEISAQAWQGSQQCVNLFQLGFFSPSEQDIRFVKSSKALEIAQDESDDKGHKRCVIKEPSCEVDTRWMTAPVAVERFSTTVIRNRFARISRPGEIPPNMGNLRMYFNDPKYKRLSFIETISDFHVLIFLMDHVFGESEIPHIVSAVLAKDNAAVSGYEELIKDHFRHTA